MPDAHVDKIFCVGSNKTGTTSLAAFFVSLGFRLGSQEMGETLLRDYAFRNFHPIVALAHSATFFQDVPFSCPFTFQAMDMAFPGSKFILSVRDNPDRWCDSLIRFHTKLIGKGRLPTAQDLREYPYAWPGWLLQAMQLMYDVDEDDPYDRFQLIDSYDRHIYNVQRYFKKRPDALLTINVGDDDAAERLLAFVGVPQSDATMPRLNRSEG